MYLSVPWHLNRMTKTELAHIIHEYNLPCKEDVKPKQVCSLCFRIAGYILNAQGNELIRLGLEKK